MIRSIVTIPDETGAIPSVLTSPAEPVVFDGSEEQFEELLTLTGDMVETMISGNGVGLAAPQIGISKRIIVIHGFDNHGKPCEYHTVMVNPKLTFVSKNDQWFDSEGCLSIPEVFVRIKRPKVIKVEYFTINGKPRKMRCEGKVARIIQHEIDHLNGKLITTPA